ncbi:MAG: LacI family DNA-binding transcriptional regulator [Rhodospirillales bacterium]|nr:LacI family DNA-binding transcriptional regulator [Rhodospirillales bacterium]
MPRRAEPGPARFVTAGAVARRAGVSRSTVSRAFTPGKNVSPEARSRIITAASEMGYRVNRLAQGLIRSRSHLVGLVGANLGTPFHASQVAALSEALFSHGMQCLLLNADRPGRDVAPLIANLLEFRARAVVILSGTPPTAIVEECRRSGLRVILINKPLPDVAAHTILCDDAGGARLAAERLLSAGCRRLALIGSASGTASIMRRIEAFRAYLTRRRIEPVIWCEGPTGYETGVAAARNLLGRARIEGAFCVTDLIAMGFMDVARHERDRRVPEDLSVIGFDDIPQASWHAYRLTTIRQSVPQLVAAVMHAIARDDEPAPGRAPAVLPVSLVERQSVRPK